MLEGRTGQVTAEDLGFVPAGRLDEVGQLDGAVCHAQPQECVCDALAHRIAGQWGVTGDALVLRIPLQN
jgi:hypothetical protein